MPPSNPPAPPLIVTSPPFHPIPGISNFRDIGGLPVTSSNPSTPLKVRESTIFRGSDTTRITTAGISALQSLNIGTDFDLRSKQQIEKAGGFKDMGEAGIQRVWAPVFSDEEYTEERARERYEMYASEETTGIVTAFIEILTAGAPMIKTVLTHLLATHSASNLSTSSPPALFLHCTTGNNRTGVFIALLLLLLHVPRTYIVYEYTLSDAGMAATRHINIERLLVKGAFAEYAPDEARRKCERMVGARRESMEALLDEAERRWGGAEGYFKRVVGLSEDEIEGVRKVMVVEGHARVPGRHGETMFVDGQQIWIREGEIGS